MSAYDLSFPLPPPPGYNNNNSLRPQFWVLRPQTNTMVPLIAMDELPPTINIPGVPRSLEVRDLTGMTCVGSADSRHATYVVEMPRDIQPLASSTSIPTAIRTLAPAVVATTALSGIDSTIATTSSPSGRRLQDSMFATPSHVGGFGFPLPGRPPHPTAATDATTIISGNADIFSQPAKAYGISEQMPSHIKSHVTGNVVPLVGFPSNKPTVTHTATLAPEASLPPVSSPTHHVDRSSNHSSDTNANPRLNLNPPAATTTLTTTTPAHPLPLPPWQNATTIPMKAAPGVKEYCSFWLRYGECDYAQQGCLYKHEMPLDRAVLERLGHRDIPRWYREKHGLGSFLAAPAATSPALASSDQKGGRTEKTWSKLPVGERGAPLAVSAFRLETKHAPVSGASAGAGTRGRKVKRGLGSSSSSSSTPAGATTSSTTRITTRRADKKAIQWRDEWEKKCDGRFAPKAFSSSASSGKKALAATSEIVKQSAESTLLIDTEITPVKPSVGGPGWRSLMAEATAAGGVGGGDGTAVDSAAASSSSSSTDDCGYSSGSYYRSPIAKKVDEATIAALAAEEHAKKAQGEKERDLQGPIYNSEILEPKRRSVNNNNNNMTQAKVSQKQQVITPSTTGSSGNSGDESEWLDG